MALQILERKGVYYLNGRINCSTVRSFIIYFEHYISKSKSVTINMDKVKEIDMAGMDAIKTLMAIALKKRKKFLTVGYKGAFKHLNNFGIS
ncbi:STAS domain-containing protein [Tenacibaculum aiptasiae]|uniref:STAS domain-containing protein n=1 Tax=Tenacibaculum aiptasiae TaxID=426481 RepID=A0A7J5ANN0_9FLAO|nr:STAS domain-containing protein [Tenacibaculum aiptasiae]KAB1158579.1 hypothetical protein F7018_08140 [Tenacibaculum aiptasiae]